MSLPDHLLRVKYSRNIQTLLFIFSVEGVVGDSHFPLKQFNHISRVLLFSKCEINISLKKEFHFVYCSPFILCLCPFCTVILSVRYMGFTLPEFMTIEHYIRYSRFFHWHLVLTGCFILLTKAVKYSFCCFSGYVKVGC